MNKSASTADGAITDAEADLLFSGFAAEPALVLAVSGGPDSTALMVLAARWGERRRHAVLIQAVTIDHGLRAQARLEAAAVKRLAARLGVAHCTRRWTGPKPATALQEKARAARYQLLHEAACEAGARFVLTAHTRDDQAETVLLRLMHGSGIAGIGGMASEVAFSDLVAAAGWHASASGGPQRDGTAGRGGRGAVSLVRPFLGLPKARLIATLHDAGVGFADDPSNRDPRFTRARLRALMPALAAEGLTPQRLDRLARRMRRAEAALVESTEAAATRFGFGEKNHGPIALPQCDWGELPAEIALRLLGLAIGSVGDEGPVELGKLEAISDALTAARREQAEFRRTLAGAIVSLQNGMIVVERAPPRRSRGAATAPLTGQR